MSFGKLSNIHTFISTVKQFNFGVASDGCPEFIIFCDMSCLSLARSYVKWTTYFEIWKFGGNVLEVRYAKQQNKLCMRSESAVVSQLETLYDEEMNEFLLIFRTSMCVVTGAAHDPFGEDHFGLWKNYSTITAMLSCRQTIVLKCSRASGGPFLAALLPFRVRSSNSKLTFFSFSGTETSEIIQF